MNNRKRSHFGYSVTPDQVNQVLLSQGNVCDICKRSLSYKDSKIDHDHFTGELRGLLCHHCNIMLGFCKDDPAILQSAIHYLSRHATPVQWPNPLPRKSVVEIDWDSILSTDSKGCGNEYEISDKDSAVDRRRRVQQKLGRLK